NTFLNANLNALQCILLDNIWFQGFPHAKFFVPTHSKDDIIGRINKVNLSTMNIRMFRYQLTIFFIPDENRSISCPRPNMVINATKRIDLMIRFNPFYQLARKFYAILNYFLTILLITCWRTMACEVMN